MALEGECVWLCAILRNYSASNQGNQPGKLKDPGNEIGQPGNKTQTS